MKKTILTLLTVYSSFSIELFAQTPNFNWAHGFQSDYNNIISTTDASGNFYVSTSIGDGWGSTTHDPQASVSTTYISGQWTQVLAKYDANGDFIWMNDYAHPNGIGSALPGVSINAISTNSNNEVIVTGSFIGTFDFDLGPGTTTLTSNGDYDAFVLKLNTNGELLWLRQIGGVTAENSMSLTIDNNNNIIISGTYSGTIDLNPNAGIDNVTSQGGQDVFIVKLDDNGGMVYGKSIGSISNDAPVRIAHSSTNEIYVAGWYFNSNGDFNPDSGVASISYNGTSGNFIVKLNQTGDFVYAKAFGNYANSNVKDMKVDGNGNINLAGNYSATLDLDPANDTINFSPAGNQDIYILQLSPSGTTNWIRTIGSANSEEVYSLDINSNNELLIGTSFIGTVDFNPGIGTFDLTSATSIQDAAFLNLNSSGTFINAYHFNTGNAGIFINSIALDNSNNIYSAGIFYGIIDFDFGTGTQNLTSMSSNLYIAKWGNIATGFQAISSKNNSMTIFPNPATNYISIEKNKPASVSIFNTIGQEIFSKQIQTKEIIDISPLENGIYIVRDNETGENVKFIKQ